MKRDAFHNLLDAYLVDDLQGESLEAFERALKENPEFRRELDEHLKLTDLMGEMETPNAPPSLRQNVMRTLRAEAPAETASPPFKNFLGLLMGALRHTQLRAAMAVCLIAIVGYSVLPRLGQDEKPYMTQTLDEYDYDAAYTPSERKNQAQGRIANTQGGKSSLAAPLSDSRGAESPPAPNAFPPKESVLLTAGASPPQSIPKSTEDTGLLTVEENQKVKSRKTEVEDLALIDDEAAKASLFDRSSRAAKPISMGIENRLASESSRLSKSNAATPTPKPRPTPRLRLSPKSMPMPIRADGIAEGEAGKQIEQLAQKLEQNERRKEGLEEKKVVLERLASEKKTPQSSSLKVGEKSKSRRSLAPTLAESMDIRSDGSSLSAELPTAEILASDSPEKGMTVLPLSLGMADVGSDTKIKDKESLGKKTPPPLRVTVFLALNASGSSGLAVAATPLGGLRFGAARSTGASADIAPQAPPPPPIKISPSSPPAPGRKITTTAVPLAFVRKPTTPSPPAVRKIETQLHKLGVTTLYQRSFKIAKAAERDADHANDSSGAAAEGETLWFREGAQSNAPSQKSLGVLHCTVQGKDAKWVLEQLGKLGIAAEVKKSASKTNLSRSSYYRLPQRKSATSELSEAALSDSSSQPSVFVFELVFFELPPK